MKKRIAAFLLIFLFALNGIFYSLGANTGGKAADTTSGEKLSDYFSAGQEKKVIDAEYYGYMTFVKNFRNNKLAMCAMEMAGQLLETGAEPGLGEYMEILVHTMTIYDLRNSSDIAEQKKMDNLKTMEDYGSDLLEMGMDACSVMAGLSPSDAVSEEISATIDSLKLLMDNGENWAESLAEMETIVEDYAVYDEFLKTVEARGRGKLRVAAGILRNGLEQVATVRLQIIQKTIKENAKNFGSYLFSGSFLELLMNLPEYEENRGVRFLVNIGLEAAEIAGGSYWELEKDIGKLVGNMVIGSEDLITRVQEMMALYDISVILQDELEDIRLEFVQKVGTSEEEKLVKQYGALSLYLLSCRIRGEYCCYSIVAEDGGLVSELNFLGGLKAEKWYQEQAEEIEKLMTDVKKILEPEGAVLNREQLEYIRWALGVPEELEVEVEQSLPYYWEGAGYWLIYVSFLYQGECVAAVEADAVTGEPLKGFYRYSY